MSTLIVKWIERVLLFMAYKGLTDVEVRERQEKYGMNELYKKKKHSIFKKLLEVITEPMFILLILAATIYFVLGEARDGAIMLVFVFGMISIETIQEWKTDKTLKALKELSSPKVRVIRNGIEVEIDSLYLVPDDIMILYEGIKIPADGIIMDTLGLCVDESSLTGESEGKWKKAFIKEEADEYFKAYCCYAGTICIQGKAYVKVTNIGLNTEYGKIADSVLNEKAQKTLLEKQTSKLVKICAILAGILFLVVGILTFIISKGTIKNRFIDGILSGITLAMAMIPEEFPVILTIFLSMGAWRLAKKNSLVKKLPAVETLGAVSVLCVDKTGTITENKMEVSEVSYKINSFPNEDEKKEIAKISLMASIKDSFDSMEIAILNYASNLDINIEDKIVHSFPFTNETKMMGNVYQVEDKYTLAVKGACETIIELCPSLSPDDKENINKLVKEYSLKGLRVLAVAKEVSSEIIDTLETRNMEFVGLITFVDPERKGIKENILKCYNAGIRVVMITGDNGDTAGAIAKKIGIKNYDKCITGSELNEMTDEELKTKLNYVNIFSRVIPEHKMRIVKCLQELGEVVAMTGDGVNDAPALKKADIGIAMGKHGSDVAREAADLVLLDDNFNTIVSTVEDGRRIYDNIKKAIGYVFTIHIPIALASLIAPMLNITSEFLFLLPLHVVLLELLIDPTCSIVLERQPAEPDIMNRSPRKITDSLIKKSLLFKSIIQGLVLFMMSFGSYYYYYQISDVYTARSFGLTILFLGNLFLVNVNSSDKEFAITSFKKLLKDKVMWITNILTILCLVIIIYTPLNNILKLDPLTPLELLVAVIFAVISVFWIEIYKLFKKRIKK